ncbi:hypothetical protein [Bradyrhizobium sp. Arg816]|uniref:hypothetical protein n=1 Tax=Bradyrhizobium sp. Arg816 TaxID=2998491 RepID=UPI00249DF7EB|nr:hypothetical protein [Bradyrhizobium sp. Arg816]MDI3564732.1 hypothetical protein [Bradyrhizobium sp. Arg816]
MSGIINFPRPAPHAAIVRLDGLTNVLSELDGENLRTQDDMRHALWVLDLANKCVRIILRDFADDPNIRQLARHAEELTASVEEARYMVQDRGNKYLTLRRSRR